MSVVIIGNSAAGMRSLETFREIDGDTPVTVISRESATPYSRVQLPYLLKARTTYHHLYFRGSDFVRNQNAEFIDATVEKLYEKSRELQLSNGRRIPYERLLIASGSTPARPSIPGSDNKAIQHVWTLEQAETLRSSFKPGKRIFILGAGFIALQIAWAAVEMGLRATLAVRSVIMRKDLDNRGRSIVEEHMANHKLDVLRGKVPEKIEQLGDGSFVIYVPESQAIEADIVVFAAGVSPNTDFLNNSSIALDNGILVDSRMQTNSPGIYAAGDVAAGPTVFGDRHRVQALWPCAVEQGRIAGANMAGKNRSYKGSLNMNVTEIFNLTLASIGRFDESDGDRSLTIEGFENRQGYIKIMFKDGIPMGALSVGSADAVGLLGLLRPYIRERKQLESEAPDFAEKLQRQLFPAAFHKHGAPFLRMAGNPHA